MTPSEPTPPPLPAVPPPLPPAAGGARRRPTVLLASLTAGVGVMQLLLTCRMAAQRSPGNLSQQIGMVVGALALWPLVVIGLFSLSRRFRTPYHRTQILLFVWSCFLLAAVANLNRRAGSLDFSPSPAAEPIAVAAETAAPPAEEPGATLVPGANEAEPDDFSAGSDQRLIRSLEGAQEERYHAVVPTYRRAVARRTADARLALERVRFIERFAFADDVNIATAAADHQAALDQLNARFPDAPGTALHHLRREPRDSLEAKARRYERLANRWPVAERAEFLLLRAQAAEATGAAVTRPLARRSFDLQPSAEAGRLLARKLQEEGRDDEARTVLLHPIFDAATPWLKRQKLDLLLAIREVDRAVALYQELRAAEPSVVRDAALASELADAGRVGEAREILAAVPTHNWNRAQLARLRFDLEFRHGSAAQAFAAYRQMREEGLAADPLLRDRLALFRRYPLAAWSLADAAGLLMLLLVVAALVVAPLGLLAPVHYWSLLRARQGRSAGWPAARWGLREAWLALAVFLLANGVAVWIFRPEQLRIWWSGATTLVLDESALLRIQGFVWPAWGAVLGALVWRARAARYLGPGTWGWRRSLVTGFGMVLVIRLLLVAYITLVPSVVDGSFATFSPQTKQLCTSLLQQFGPLGLVGAICVLVPLLEETLFRGILLQALGKHVPFVWANAGQALLFSALHENLQLVPILFIFGVVAGDLTRRAGGLGPGLIMHALNNLTVVVALLRAG